MTWYSLALFAHILGALGTFIGLGLQQTILLRLRRAQTLTQVREWGGLMRGVARIGPVSGAVLLIAGIYLTLTAWSFSTAWIDVSLATMLLMIVLGMVGTGRRLGSIQRAALSANAHNGDIPTHVRQLLAHPMPWIFAQMTTGMAVGIVFLMTTKPNLVGSLLAIAVAMLLGIVVGAVTATPRQTAQAAAIPSREAARS